VKAIVRGSFGRASLLLGLLHNANVVLHKGGQTGHSVL